MKFTDLVWSPYCTYRCGRIRIYITASLELAKGLIKNSRVLRAVFLNLSAFLNLRLDVGMLTLSRIFTLPKTSYFSGPRGAVRVATSRFCGYSSQNRILNNTLRGRKGINHPFCVPLLRRSKIIIEITRSSVPAQIIVRY